METKKELWHVHVESVGSLYVWAHDFQSAAGAFWDMAERAFDVSIPAEQQCKLKHVAQTAER
jgi:hypothetical protein